MGMGLQQTGGDFGRIFTSADGLNTISFTQVSITTICTNSLVYYMFGWIPWFPGQTAGSVTGHSFVTSSDQLLKTNVQTSNTTSCLNLLESVEAKIYTRIDTGEKRVGFIANDIQANLP